LNRTAESESRPWQQLVADMLKATLAIVDSKVPDELVVAMRTVLGMIKIVDMLAGIQLARIC
jgi:hypothetical protein